MGQELELVSVEVEQSWVAEELNVSSQHELLVPPPEMLQSHRGDIYKACGVF